MTARIQLTQLGNRLGVPLRRRGRGGGDGDDGTGLPTRQPAGKTPDNTTSFPVSLTEADLAAVHMRFEQRLPGSIWCGFASWQDTRRSRRPRPEDCRQAASTTPQAARLVLFTAEDGRRHLTLARFADGHLELTNDTGGAVASAADINDLLDVVEHPGRR